MASNSTNTLPESRWWYGLIATLVVWGWGQFSYVPADVRTPVTLALLAVALVCCVQILRAARHPWSRPVALLVTGVLIVSTLLAIS